MAVWNSVPATEDARALGTRLRRFFSSTPYPESSPQGISGEQMRKGARSASRARGEGARKNKSPYAYYCSSSYAPRHTLNVQPILR